MVAGQDIVEIGLDLIAAKKAVGHGKWLPWLEREFGMSRQTADNLIHVAEQFGSKLLTVSNLTPKILYMLAAPSTSEEVREAVTEKVSNGEKVTPSDIRELNQKFKAKLEESAERLRVVQSQKKAVDAHNSSLIEDVRAKSSEVVRITDELRHLEEEVRRLTEPGTITVSAVAASDDQRMISPPPLPDVAVSHALRSVQFGYAPNELPRDWFNICRLTNQNELVITEPS